MKERDADAIRRAADLAAVTVTCEEAYADASREGHADNPTVIAAVAALKTAHAALVLADANFGAAKDFFRLTAALWRTDRALRAARAAYVRLRAAITQVGEDNLRKMGFDSDWISNLKTLTQLEHRR